MKAEEIILRLVGGGVVGALLGIIFVVATNQFASFIYWVVGIVFVVGMLSSLLGLKHTIRTFIVFLALLLITVIFRIAILWQAGVWLLNLSHWVGRVTVTSTTASANTAMIFWGFIGSLLTLYWGLTESWEETMREIKKS